jgi:hypothetical protein
MKDLPGMKNEFEEFFDGGQASDSVSAANQWATIYYNYAIKLENAFSATFPTFVSNPNLAPNKATLVAGILAAMNTFNPIGVAVGMTTAFTAFWAAPPVVPLFTFPSDTQAGALPPPGGISPNQVTSSLAIPPTGGPALQAGLIKEFALTDPDSATPKIKAANFATLLDVFTSTVVVSITILPPSGTPVVTPYPLV